MYDMRDGIRVAFSAIRHGDDGKTRGRTKQAHPANAHRSSEFLRKQKGNLENGQVRKFCRIVQLPTKAEFVLHICAQNSGHGQLQSAVKGLASPVPSRDRSASC